VTDTTRRMMGIGPASARDPHDFYATPPETTRALLRIECLTGPIWEPCCGQGHMSEVLKAAGHTVISTDLVDYGYGEGGVNVLDQIDLRAPVVVTNPPFGISTKIISHLLSLGPQKLCILHKIQFLECHSRTSIVDGAYCRFGAGLARIYPFIGRQSLWKGGVPHTGGMLALAWFVWERGYGGLPTVRRI